MSGAKYQVIPGPQGERLGYRFTVLDANVVKDLRILHHVGLNGCRNKDTYDRLRSFLRRLPNFGEIFAGVGALELTVRLDEESEATSRFRKDIAQCNNLLNLSSGELLQVYKGAPVCEVHPVESENEGRRGLENVLPELLGDAAVLLKAWLLRGSGVHWTLALSELVQFCNTEIRYAPGIATSMAVSLVAGAGSFAGDLTGLLKNIGSEDPTIREASVINAAGDLQFLSALRRIPVISRRAAGEDLTPICGVTADRGLLKFSQILGYGVSPGHPSSYGSSIALKTDRFPPDRLAAVYEAIQKINAGQTVRRQTTKQLKNDGRYSLLATSKFLDRHGTPRWGKIAEQAITSPELWMNRKTTSQDIP